MDPKGLLGPAVACLMGKPGAIFLMPASGKEMIDTFDTLGQLSAAWNEAKGVPLFNRVFDVTYGPRGAWVYTSRKHHGSTVTLILPPQ